MSNYIPSVVCNFRPVKASCCIQDKNILVFCVQDHWSAVVKFGLGAEHYLLSFSEMYVVNIAAFSLASFGMLNHTRCYQIMRFAISACSIQS